jgi:hypothetical protein
MSFARLRALIVLGVLFVSATVVLTMAIVTDGQNDAQAAVGCGDGDVPANLTMPDDNSTVKLNGFNATTSPGLAGQVASEFRSHRFQVVKEETAPPPVLNAVAEIRYGPKVAGAAWVLRAYFLNSAKLTFDINRDDDTIDVVIGTKFLELASFTDQRQSLGQAGKPQLPAGTCDANAS